MSNLLFTIGIYTKFANRKTGPTVYSVSRSSYIIGLARECETTGLLYQRKCFNHSKLNWKASVSSNFNIFILMLSELYAFQDTQHSIPHYYSSPHSFQNCLSCTKRHPSAHGNPQALVQNVIGGGTFRSSHRHSHTAFCDSMPLYVILMSALGCNSSHSANKIVANRRIK